MPSNVTICSNALQMLGASPINSFSEGTQENGIDTARLAGNLWPTISESLLRMHPWGCATTRVVLSPEATTPAFGYAYRYVLPADWLRNVEINGVIADEVDYRTESSGTGGGKRMLTDQGTLRLVYIFNNTDTESWDSMLTHCATLAMAEAMAYSITQSTSLRDTLNRDFRLALAQAKAVDGQDESPAQFGSFEILGARRAISNNF